MEISFINQELNLKTYILDETLLTTKRVQINNQNFFIIAALALNKMVFMIYIAYLKAKMSIYTAWQTQIALLLAKMVSSSKEYAGILNVFSKISTRILLNYSDINKHAIDL